MTLNPSPIEPADERVNNASAATPQNQPDNARENDRNRRVLAGILFGIGAAVFYTLANTSMRQVSTSVDYVLAVAMRAAFTLLVGGCFFKFESLLRRNHPSSAKNVWLPIRPMLMLIGSGIVVQILGGMMMQRAFGIIGMALVVPIYIGAMVTTAAILGSLILRERVGIRLAIALAVLVSSVFVLSLGADKANAAMQTADNVIMGGASVLDGLLSATTVGISYALLGTIIRFVLLRYQISEFLPVVVVAATGTLVLGGWSVTHGGITTLQEISRPQLGWLALAGSCNAIGFSCLSKALKRLPVVYVNAINASQAALAAIVGVLWFLEPLSMSLLIGVAIMLAGFVILAKRDRKRKPGIR